MAPTDQRGEPHDRELWARLQSVLRGRPPLMPVPHPARWHSAQEAHQLAAQTVHAIDELAHRISHTVSAPAPVRDGSARAVAYSLVRLCQAFVQHWSAHPTLTVTRCEHFNRDLELVIVFLDSCTDGASPFGRHDPGER